MTLKLAFHIKSCCLIDSLYEQIMTHTRRRFQCSKTVTITHIHPDTRQQPQTKGRFCQCNVLLNLSLGRVHVYQIGTEHSVLRTDQQSLLKKAGPLVLHLNPWVKKAKHSKQKPVFPPLCGTRHSVAGMLGTVVSGIQRGVGGRGGRVARRGALEVARKGARLGRAPHWATTCQKGGSVGRGRGGAWGIVRFACISTGQDWAVSWEVRVRVRVDNVRPDARGPVAIRRGWRCPGGRGRCGWGRGLQRGWAVWGGCKVGCCGRCDGGCCRKDFGNCQRGVGKGRDWRSTYFRRACPHPGCFSHAGPVRLLLVELQVFQFLREGEFLLDGHAEERV